VIVSLLPFNVTILPVSGSQSRPTRKSAIIEMTVTRANTHARLRVISEVRLQPWACNEVNRHMAAARRNGLVGACRCRRLSTLSRLEFAAADLTDFGCDS
jgi:hypothetical protein